MVEERRDRELDYSPALRAILASFLLAIGLALVLLNPAAPFGLITGSLLVLGSLIIAWGVVHAIARGDDTPRSKT